MSGDAWQWLADETVLAIHDAQIETYGGLSGVRDAGLLQSALARPLHLAAYGTPDACVLAAAYAFGLARNHPFFDGNKRTAFVVAAVFLRACGSRIMAADAACVRMFVGLAAGEVSEAELTAWLQSATSPS